MAEIAIFSLSLDGGETWERRQVNFGVGLHAVAFWDGQTAWVGGELHGERNRPVILETRDGGLSWQEVFAAGDIQVARNR